VSTSDRIADHLLSPRNAALLIIDFQPAQVRSVVTASRRKLLRSVTTLARAARLFNLPVILATLNAKRGRDAPTIRQITDILPRAEQFDRTNLNAWEDDRFVDAVGATGRRKLIFAALWTETALTFAALSAIQEGFEAYPVVDAVGGTSRAAHEAALDRIAEAGANLTSCLQLVCELQRDSSRTRTATEARQILSALGASRFLEPL
jgi:nicotinamidase-related amidase